MLKKKQPDVTTLFGNRWVRYLVQAEPSQTRAVLVIHVRFGATVGRQAIQTVDHRLRQR